MQWLGGMCFVCNQLSLQVYRVREQRRISEGGKPGACLASKEDYYLG